MSSTTSPLTTRLRLDAARAALLAAAPAPAPAHNGPSLLRSHLPPDLDKHAERASFTGPAQQVLHAVHRTRPHPRMTINDSPDRPYASVSHTIVQQESALPFHESSRTRDNASTVSQEATSAAAAALSAVAQEQRALSAWAVQLAAERKEVDAAAAAATAALHGAAAAEARARDRDMRFTEAAAARLREREATITATEAEIAARVEASLRLESALAARELDVEARERAVAAAAAGADARAAEIDEWAAAARRRRADADAAMRESVTYRHEAARCRAEAMAAQEEAATARARADAAKQEATAALEVATAAREDAARSADVLRSTEKRLAACIEAEQALVAREEALVAAEALCAVRSADVESALRDCAVMRSKLDAARADLGAAGRALDARASAVNAGGITMPVAAEAALSVRDERSHATEPGDDARAQSAASKPDPHKAFARVDAVAAATDDAGVLRSANASAAEARAEAVAAVAREADAAKEVADLCKEVVAALAATAALFPDSQFARELACSHSALSDIASAPARARVAAAAQVLRKLLLGDGGLVSLVSASCSCARTSRSSPAEASESTEVVTSSLPKSLPAIPRLSDSTPLPRTAIPHAPSASLQLHGVVDERPAPFASSLSVPLVVARSREILDRSPFASSPPPADTSGISAATPPASSPVVATSAAFQALRSSLAAASRRLTALRGILPGAGARAPALLARTDALARRAADAVSAAAMLGDGVLLSPIADDSIVPEPLGRAAASLRADVRVLVLDAAAALAGGDGENLNAHPELQPQEVRVLDTRPMVADQLGETVNNFVPAQAVLPSRPPPALSHPPRPSVKDDHSAAHATPSSQRGSSLAAVDDEAVGSVARRPRTHVPPRPDARGASRALHRPSSLQPLASRPSLVSVALSTSAARGDAASSSHAALPSVVAAPVSASRRKTPSSSIRTNSRPVARASVLAHPSSSTQRRASPRRLPIDAAVVAAALSPSTTGQKAQASPGATSVEVDWLGNNDADYASVANDRLTGHVFAAVEDDGDVDFYDSADAGGDAGNLGAQANLGGYGDLSLESLAAL